MANNVVIGAYTLPPPARPDGYGEVRENKVVYQEMSDGTFAQQQLASGNVITLDYEWKGLTVSEATSVKNAHLSLSGTTASHTTPQDETFTVALNPQSSGLQIRWYKSGGAIRADARISLISA